MSENKQPFRQDASVNRSSNKINVDPSQKLNKKNGKDRPDQFIKKMESTMSKKRKNNYKNIEQLENIYDTKPKTNKSVYSKYNYTPGEISEALDELEESMKTIFDSYSTDKNGGKQNKQLEEDTIEGFSNKSSEFYENVFYHEYEFGKKPRRVTRKKLLKIANNARMGKLNITKLKVMLNTGEITDAEYNWLLGFYLNVNGFSWENIETQPKNKGNSKCAKWNKDCGNNGPSLLDIIVYVINKIKQFVGIYFQTLRYISTHIYKSTDGKIDGKPSNNAADVSIIVNILHYLIMTILSIWFAYNWFYITFYKDQTDNPIEIDFSYNILSSLIGIAKAFKHLVQPMILVDLFLRVIVPSNYYKITNTLTYLTIWSLDFSFIGKILSNPILIFIALTLIILFMTCKYSEKFTDMFISYLRDDDVPYQKYLHAAVAYSWMLGITDEIMMAGLKASFGELQNPVITGVFFVIIVLFSHLFIRFGGLFILLYLYIMSYAALAIYSPAGIFGAVKSINIAFESSINNTDNKYPKDEWEKTFINILNIIYTYLFQILYIIVLLYSTGLILLTMKSNSGKIILGSGLIIIICLIAMLIAILSINSNIGIKKSDIDLPKNP